MQHSTEIKGLKKIEDHWKNFSLGCQQPAYVGYIKNDRGALYALKTKEGDCTEFMHLFVALCRANKIPARCIGGYVQREKRDFKTC